MERLVKNRYVRLHKGGKLSLDAIYRNYVDIATLKPHIVSGSKVLDAGAGSGGVSSLLVSMGCDVVALDFAVSGLKRLKEEIPEAQCVVGDVKNLPFIRNCFDSEILWGTLEYGAIVGRAMEEARRVIQQTVLFTGWNAGSPFSRTARIIYREHTPFLFSMSAVRRTLRECGLEVISVEGLFFVLPAELAAIRAIVNMLRLPKDKIAFIAARINQRLSQSLLGRRICPIVFLKATAIETA